MIVTAQEFEDTRKEMNKVFKFYQEGKRKDV